jgi:hypothetical protein
MASVGSWITGSGRPPTAMSRGPRKMAARTAIRQAREFFVGWEGIASDAVAILRAEAGRNPYDRRLSDLIGELSTRSDEFRVRWAAHNVKFHRTGTKQLHHPIVGGHTLAYEALELPADHGQRILVYTAEPGSPSDDALTLLATWSATTPLTEPHTDAAR